MRKLDGGNFDAANRAAIKLVSRHWSEIRNGAGAPKRAVSSSFALHGRAMNGERAQVIRRLHHGDRVARPALGRSRVDDLVGAAAPHGLELLELVEMPANNLSLVFVKVRQAVPASYLTGTATRAANS